MSRFKKKPVEVEAWKVLDLLRSATHDWPSLPVQIEDAYEEGKIVFTVNKIHITTLEGTMYANLGDWVICGVQGELYPCKPDIFDATYEPVES